MKPIKTLGIAVLTALAVTAFVGTSSAVSETTALCNVDPGTGSKEGCPAGHLVTHVHEVSVGKAELLTGRAFPLSEHLHEVTLSSDKMKLLTTFLTVECDDLFLGDVISEKAREPQEVEGNLTYTNCGSCTAKETSKQAIVYFLKLGHELADVTYTYEVHFVCGSSLDCTYNGKGLEGHALGPLLSTAINGEVRVLEKTTTKIPGGFLCPKKASLDLVLTSLDPTYITEGDGEESTARCKIDPGEGVDEWCATEGLNVECKALFLGDAVGELDSPLVIKGHFTYTECGSCEVEEKVGTATLVKVLKLGHELADVTGEGEVHVKCGPFLDCTYNGKGLEGHALGPLLSTGANGEVRTEEKSVEKVAGGLLCPKTSKLDLLTTSLTATYVTN